MIKLCKNFDYYVKIDHELVKSISAIGSGKNYHLRAILSRSLYHRAGIQSNRDKATEATTSW